MLMCVNGHLLLMSDCNMEAHGLSLTIVIQDVTFWKVKRLA